MGKVQLNVWVEDAQRDAIRRLALERGVPVGRLVTEAVLGLTETPDASLARQASSALARADLAVERVAGVESSVENLEGRLGRLEAMAQGASY